MDSEDPDAFGKILRDSGGILTGSDDPEGLWGILVDSEGFWRSRGLLMILRDSEDPEGL